MTGRASVFSEPERDVAATVRLDGTEAGRTNGIDHSHGSAHAGREAEIRFSPDPLRHTDRYRLVTPFSLRL